MNRRRGAAAVAVLSLCIISLLAAPTAAQQSQRGDNGREQSLESLWRLYPLDPESGQKDRMPRIKIDTPGHTPPVSSRPEQPRESGEATREDRQAGLSILTLILATTLLCTGSLLIGVVARRARQRRDGPRFDARESQGVSVGQDRRVERQRQTFATSHVVERAAELSPVRIHLRNGRVVEGRVKQAATQERPVLLLDVTDVADAEGHKRDPDPLDAFIPLAEVENIEVIGKVDASVANVTGRGQ